MSNVKTKLKNLFKTGDQVQPRVGNTYGARRGIQQPQVTQIPVRRKQIDRFNRKDQNPKNLAKFAPQATFKAGAPIFSHDIPYKARAHDYIETGMAKGMAKSATVYDRPEDRTILNFLDKVIAFDKRKTNVAQTAKPAVQKTNPRQYPTGQPAVPTRTAAQVRTRPIQKIKS